MNKKAFTIVELIFIIAILGIILAVALPKIKSTRDEVEMRKFTSNLSTLIKDVKNYYLSYGKLANDIKQMSHIHLEYDLLGSTGNLQIKNENCLNVEINDSTDSIQFNKSENASKLCNEVLKRNEVKAILSEY